MHNPEEILGTSKFHNPLFWKNNYYIIHFLFCCLQEYINDDIVKHQNAKHKTLGIVIAHVLISDWKNTTFWVNFQLFI